MHLTRRQPWRHRHSAVQHSTHAASTVRGGKQRQTTEFMAATGAGRRAMRRCRCGSKPVGTGTWCLPGWQWGPGKSRSTPPRGSFDRQLQCLCPFCLWTNQTGGNGREERACASAIPRHMEHGVSTLEAPKAAARSPLAPSESACAVPRPRLPASAPTGKGKARRLGSESTCFHFHLPSARSIIKINLEFCQGSRILILAADRI